MTIQELINSLQKLIESGISSETKVLFKEPRIQLAHSVDYAETGYIDVNGFMFYEDEDIDEECKECLILKNWNC